MNAQSKAEVCKVVCTFLENAPAPHPVFTLESVLSLLDVLASEEPYINVSDLAFALGNFFENSSDEALKAAAKEKLLAIAPQRTQAAGAGRIDKFFISRLRAAVDLRQSE
ncbi:hypothetical protein HZA42_05085 [Candidatus Peregrinibacteria bacterium]|nr:hypothetical protein [Candidatus Peregrinibacteria bacterium]